MNDRITHRRGQRQGTESSDHNGHNDGTLSPRRAINRVKSNDGLPFALAYYDVGSPSDGVTATTTITQSNNNKLSLLLAVVALLLVVLLVVVGYVAYNIVNNQSNKISNSIHAHQNQVESQQLLTHLRTLEHKLGESHHEGGSGIKELKEQLERAIGENTKLTETLTRQQEENRKVLDRQIDQGNLKLRGGAPAVAEIQKLRSRIDRLEAGKFRMQQGIQQLSKTLLEIKYGKGPHRVQINVRDFGMTPPREDRIVIELASSELMPHTTLWFLEQVSLGLYVGCSFYRNAGHIIQAGPVYNPASGKKLAYHRLDDRFSKAKYHSVLFQEYSEAHPHSEYTVGYAGRPGGPGTKAECCLTEIEKLSITALTLLA